MPKGLNLKGFTRRKSSGTAIDFDAEATPTASQSSFRVIQRPDNKPLNGPDRNNGSRPFSSPLEQLRAQSADNLGLGQNRWVQGNRQRSARPLNFTRGSGGTTNSGSSGYYESSAASARHSSSSTLPSSVDHDRDPNADDGEDLYPRKSRTTPMNPSAADSGEQSAPRSKSFSNRAARALSFGKNNRPPPIQDVPPLPPPHTVTSPPRSYSPPRERALTTSSYASTAVPLKAELTLTDLGNDDFGTIFETFGRSSPQPPPPTAVFHRTESDPMFPPRRQSRQTLTPSPNQHRFTPDENGSPYAWEDSNPREGLLVNQPKSSPKLDDGGLELQLQTSGIARAILGNDRSPSYVPVPDGYNSPGPDQALPKNFSRVAPGNLSPQDQQFPRRQTQLDDGDRWVKRVELRDPPAQTRPDGSRRFTPAQNRKTFDSSLASSSTSRSGGVSPGTSDVGPESSNTTPRAGRLQRKTIAEDSLFDTSPSGPASRAIKPGSQVQRPGADGMKRMTKAQFQMLQKWGESSSDQSEDEDHASDDDAADDDEDEIERAKQMAKQRIKQEANMSVYRQQMKKVTGGGPTDLPSASAVRPSLDRTSLSAPTVTGGHSLHFGGIGPAPPTTDTRRSSGNEEDEDEDIPLGILQAHGFPSTSRPPTRAGENDLAQQRRTSVAGSVAGGGAGQGNLPPFARRLPADPYFGAGLVNQNVRESLPYTHSTPSVYGAQGQMLQPQGPSSGHPGGLVGVIAGEERARAARRGSPNAANGFPPMPSNMPAMPRTMSMGNLAPPQAYPHGGMPPMPMMPQMMMPQMPQMPANGDPNSQQMQQFMQMQMQLMQNLLQMQAQMGQTPGQAGPAPSHRQSGSMGMTMDNGSRAFSQSSTSLPFQQQQGQQRAMTMMNPPPGWNDSSNASQPRHNSAMPNMNAPFMSELKTADGPGPDYTPSIAPSERSNVGMPSRYRPVTSEREGTNGGGRSQSMTSSFTTNLFHNQQVPANLPGTPFNPAASQNPTSTTNTTTTAQPNSQKSSTIRIIDKPKGTPKVSSAMARPPPPADDDEDDGWAEMQKKRDTMRKSWWNKKGKNAKSSSAATDEQALRDLYTELD